MAGAITSGPAGLRDEAAASPRRQVEGLEDALWTFALAFYGRPGIAPACLALQERLGLDVCLLLLVLFARLERGIALSPDEIAAADAAVAGWRAEVVRPLRALRTRLKSGPLPATDAATEALRAGIKAQELAAERIELAALADWLVRRGTGASRPDADVPALLARALATRFVTPGDPVVAGALATLADAAAAWRAAEPTPSPS